MSYTGFGFAVYVTVNIEKDISNCRTKTAGLGFILSNKARMTELVRLDLSSFIKCFTINCYHLDFKKRKESDLKVLFQKNIRYFHNPYNFTIYR